MSQDDQRARLPLACGHMLGIASEIAIERWPDVGTVLLVRPRGEVHSAIAEVIAYPYMDAERPLWTANTSSELVGCAYRKLYEAGFVRYTGQRSALDRPLWEEQPPGFEEEGA